MFSFDAPDFLINGVSFVPPTVPVLLQIISGTTAAGSYNSVFRPFLKLFLMNEKLADLLPSGSVYALPLNSSIQLSFDASLVDAIGGPVSSDLAFIRLLTDGPIFS